MPEFMWIPMAETLKKDAAYWVYMTAPYLCNNAIYAQMAHFEDGENLRLSERTGDISRIIKEVYYP